MYFDKKLKHLTYLSSAILSIIFLLLIFYLGLFYPEPPYWIPLSVDVNNVIVCSIILVLLPPAIIEFLNSRWLDGVEKNVHRLLQDVTEEVKSGEPLINALEVSASADYGPLSPLLRESLVRFNLTSNFRDAMNWFGVNLVKPVGSQMASILLESYETGGEITDVLISSVKLFKTIEDDRLHRKSQTRPYLFVIYTGIGSFLRFYIEAEIFQRLHIVSKVGIDVIVRRAYEYATDLSSYAVSLAVMGMAILLYYLLVMRTNEAKA